jgi:hypothetical protein
MSTTATESRPSGSAGRRGGGRGGISQLSEGARGGATRRKKNPNASRPPPPTTKRAPEEQDSRTNPSDDKVSLAAASASLTLSAVNEAAGDPSTEADICWLCAEPVKYYSVPECNHRTCHVCALRLRALYKKMECTLCKVGKLPVQSFKSTYVASDSRDLYICVAPIEPTTQGHLYRIRFATMGGIHIGHDTLHR